MSEKPQVIVLNKIDLLNSDESAIQFESALNDREVLLISALTGAGIRRLISHLEDMLGRNDE